MPGRENINSNQNNMDSHGRGKSLNTKKWKFLKPGYGVEQKEKSNISDEEAFYKYEGKCGALPRSGVANARQRDKKKAATNYSKQKSTIDKIQDELSQHPLAIFPHLEESIPADIFKEVVEILDPEMSEYIATGERQNEGVFNSAGPPSSSTTSSSSKSGRSSHHSVASQAQEVTNVQTVSNPYLWKTPGEESDTEEKQQDDKPKLKSQTQDEETLKVTKSFCDWVASMGGDDNNIEENTLLTLFASGYETKPTLAVPIQVVELNNIPPELKALATAPGNLDQVDDDPSEKLDASTCKGYKGDSKKKVYGRWYLKPDRWSLRATDEPMRDPRNPSDNELSSIKAQSLQLDKELAQLHGTRLFMDFVNKKDVRKPEFLQNIENIRIQQHFDRKSSADLG